MAAAAETPTKAPAAASLPEDFQHDITNGNGAVQQSDALSPSGAAAPKENIFLFWPNIIGTMPPRVTTLPNF